MCFTVRSGLNPILPCSHYLSFCLLLMPTLCGYTTVSHLASFSAPSIKM